jgi:hypothetical protein
MEQSLLALLVAFLCLWLVVSISIADHAVDNGKTQLWGVAVFFTGIFGLVGYAISLASD